MAIVKPLSDDELSPEARVIFDDIRRTRQSDFVSDFWRALAHDPKTLGRPWESVKEVMAPGAFEPKVKEMLYVAVSIAHGWTGNRDSCSQYQGIWGANITGRPFTVCPRTAQNRDGVQCYDRSQD